MALPHMLNREQKAKATAACNKIPFIEAVKIHMIFHLPFKIVIKVTQLGSTGNKW